jgi:cytoskeletal protein CcmA (bactofilin family)
MFSSDSSKHESSDSITSASPRGGMPSIVSPDLRVQGDLTSTGDIQVEGIVDGGVFCRQVTIGESGSVIGAIESELAHVSGQVQGQIRAKSVSLTDTARVEADISYETLTVEAGAQLKGRCACQSWAGGVPTAGTQGKRVGVGLETTDEKSRSSEARAGEKKEGKPAEDKTHSFRRREP